MVNAAIHSGIARPATIRSEALFSRTLRDAIQPTTMKAAYIATTARIAGLTLLELGVFRFGTPDPHQRAHEERGARDGERGEEAARRRERADDVRGGGAGDAAGVVADAGGGRAGGRGEDLDDCGPEAVD